MYLSVRGSLSTRHHTTTLISLTTETLWCGGCYFTIIIITCLRCSAFHQNDNSETECYPVVGRWSCRVDVGQVSVNQRSSTDLGLNVYSSSLAKENETFLSFVVRTCVCVTLLKKGQPGDQDYYTTNIGIDFCLVVYWVFVYQFFLVACILFILFVVVLYCSWFLLIKTTTMKYKNNINWWSSAVSLSVIREEGDDKHWLTDKEFVIL